jgi:hypothetical protein
MISLFDPFLLERNEMQFVGVRIVLNRIGPTANSDSLTTP